jgi:hypothetical protein
MTSSEQAGPSLCQGYSHWSVDLYHLTLLRSRVSATGGANLALREPVPAKETKDGMQVDHDESFWAKVCCVVEKLKGLQDKGEVFASLNKGYKDKYARKQMLVHQLGRYDFQRNIKTS